MRQDTANDGPESSRHKRRRLLAVAAGLLFSGLALAHLHVGERAAEQTGPLLVADHLFDISLAIAMLAICIALGRLALAKCRLEFDQALETLVFSAALGAAIVSVCLLISGLLGAFQPLTVVALLLVLAVIARRELAGLPRLCARSAEYVRARAGHPAYAVGCAVIVGLVAAVVIVHAVAPPTDWDSLMYHLNVPRQFLQAGRIFAPEDNLHVAFVGLVHMLYVPLLALKSSSAPAILSALFALLLGLGMFSLAARFFDGATASLSFIIVWATTSILLVAITPRVDVTLALFLFLAHYSLLLALARRSSKAYAYLAAALLGFAVGIKYHAFAYAVALSPLVLWIERARGASSTSTLKHLALFAAIVIAAAAPWLAKNWLLLEAPLYPFLSERMLEPWLASLYGSSAIPADVDPGVFGSLSAARARFNLLDLFLSPGRLTVEQEGSHYHMNVLFLLLPLWLLFLRNRTINWLAIPAVSYVVLVVLPFPLTNLRYLIPAYGPLTIVVAHLVACSARRLLSADAARLLLIAVVAVALFPSGKAMHFWFRKSQVLAYAVGAASQQQYLDTGYSFYSQMTRAVNQNVPEGGKVLLFFESRGYYFKPDVIQDNMLTNWAYLAPAASEGADCLESTGITHVLVSDLAIRYYVHRGPDPRSFRLGLLADFADRCLLPLHGGSGFTILRLRAGPGGSARIP